MPVNFGPNDEGRQSLSAAPPGNTPPTHCGTVCHWNADRNFGFVKPLGVTDRERNIFVIARLFAAAGLTPRIGLRVQYQLGPSTPDGDAQIAKLWAAED